MGYKWKNLKFHQTDINRPHNVKFREIFAKQLITLLVEGKQIISLDDSSFNSNQCLMQGWVKRGCAAIKSTLSKFKNISLISEKEFSGEHYYSFDVGNNNRYTFIRYLEQLVERLDRVQKHWRNKKVIVLDNACVHSFHEVKNVIESKQKPILFLGMASFLAILIE